TTVLRIGDRPVAVELRGFEVEVVEGPDQGKRARPTRRGFLVGSHEPCDLRLSDPHVSRHHLRIDPEEQEYVLPDLGSTNGTRVHGVRVREAVVDDGVRIECGQTAIRFTFTDTPMRIDLAESDDFEGLLGRSVAMRELFALLERVAPTDAPVLIEG